MSDVRPTPHPECSNTLEDFSLAERALNCPFCLTKSINCQGNYHPRKATVVLPPSGKHFWSPLREVYIRHWTANNGFSFKVVNESQPKLLQSLLRTCQMRWRGFQYKLYAFEDIKYELKGAVHIDSDEKFSMYLKRFFDLDAKPVYFCIFECTVDESYPKEKPTKPGFASPEGSASSFSDSRDSAISLFIKKTGGFTCAFCDFKGRDNLEAAYIYRRETLGAIKCNDKKLSKMDRKETTAFLRMEELLLKYDLSGGINDLANMICLCPRCHRSFDAGRIGIKPYAKGGGKLIVSKSISDAKLIYGDATYGSLQGKQVKFSGRTPSKALLDYRYEYYLDMEKERKQVGVSGLDFDYDDSSTHSKKRNRSAMNVARPAKRRKDEDQPTGAKPKGITIVESATIDKMREMWKAFQNIKQVEDPDSLLSLHGMHLRPCQGDGDCFLHALRIHVPEYSFLKLREFAQNGLAELFQGFDFYQVEDLLEDVEVETIDQYIEYIGCDRSWFSLPAITALARQLNIQINIYSRDSFVRGAATCSKINERNLGESPRQIVPVFYNGHNHYDGIVIHHYPTRNSSSSAK